jgi:hypothetical protein
LESVKLILVTRTEVDAFGDIRTRGNQSERLPLAMVASFPSIVIPFELGIVTPEFQVAEQEAGSMTVSPLVAESIAFCTSEFEQLFA